MVLQIPTTTLNTNNNGLQIPITTLNTNNNGLQIPITTLNANQRTFKNRAMLGTSQIKGYKMLNILTHLSINI